MTTIGKCLYCGQVTPLLDGQGNWTCSHCHFTYAMSIPLPPTLESDWVDSSLRPVPKGISLTILRMLDDFQSLHQITLARTANDNRHKNPDLHVLVEEFSEAVLSARGKHKDPLRLELIQLAGVCINIARQLDEGKVFTL